MENLQCLGFQVKSLLSIRLQFSVMYQDILKKPATPHDRPPVHHPIVKAAEKVVMEPVDPLILSEGGAPYLNQRRTKVVT